LTRFGKALDAISGVFVDFDRYGANGCRIHGALRWVCTSITLA
jgi:hypothetical protein